MQKYAIYQKVGESNKAYVTSLIHNPHPTQFVKNGVFTESAIPVVEQSNINMEYILMINLEDNTLYLDFKENKSIDREVQEIKTQQELISSALEEIILGGM